MPPPEPEQVKAAYEERLRILSLAVESRMRELAVLSAVATRIHGEEDAQAILDATLEEILGRMDLKAAWIFMGDQKERKLHLAASRGVAAAYLEETRTQGLGECLCPEVFWSGHRMQARNTTQCPRMPSIVEGLGAPVAHACIPLLLEGESRGVLNVAARPGEQFSDDELRFLETLGHQVCLALERASHIRSERLRNQEARAMAAINKAIGGSLDVDSVLKAVGETAQEILGADQVYVFLGSDPRRVTVGYASRGQQAEVEVGHALDLVEMGWALSVRALRERQLLRIDDRDVDEWINRGQAERLGVAAAIVTPLVAHEQVLGVLVLARGAAHHWSGEQVEIVEALASQASLALENARLYEKARGAYQDLKDAQQRILQTEKMAVLGTFASGLAHEVRNPLNSIALQISILERRVARLDASAYGDLGDLIGVIREEIKRLDSLVGDFLLFSRTSRIQYNPTSLDALIDEVARLLRPEARATGVTLRRQRIGDAIPDLRVDAEKIKQVVINLVRNAIEAMPAGGVVVLESGLVDSQPRVVVRDNGPGLPEGLDVFQLFVTTKPRGTGLGLSIAQQIVLDHGGEIKVSSEPGKGATFTVSLPATLAEDMPREGAQR